MKTTARRMLRMMIYMLLMVSVCITNVPRVWAKEHFIVCIDPGHQAKGDPKGEPIAPGSPHKKARVASGTAGVATKKPEYAVNMEAALILRDLLTQKGYEVIMTRETNKVNVSNVERAEIANNAHADMTIRLHCDSIGNGGKSGAVLIVPAKAGTHTAGIYKPSYDYAQLLKKSLEGKGVKVNGIFERGDMTGFNWSKVPVIIFEMGFMSNWNEDRMLSDKGYQQKLMEAVTEALDAYNQTLN
ncbi:N-acetylmuramoyl-L-alanine amidase [Cellulosilyticum ruminicola]|uniref:N-acetylmuramoyl-L-alanine amidase n=1 Tax=Cellulosilyticum ruminicola TaxID=425254 RepID=UPI001FA72CC7|nr:N-acetylmuramoyl-L-alanine amidase [Cellulosilyticum ruminicola]